VPQWIEHLGEVVAAIVTCVSMPREREKSPALSTCKINVMIGHLLYYIRSSRKLRVPNGGLIRGGETPLRKDIGELKMEQNGLA